MLDKSLVKYLKQCQALFALDRNQQLNHLTKQNFLRFDSGMTKIHALLDTAGSPIYDGRIGAAIALLYRLYRQSTGTTAPQALDFAGPGIGDQIRNPEHLKLGYNGTPQLSTTSRHPWARRQLQLGWIIRAVLEGSELFAKQPQLVDRCATTLREVPLLAYNRPWLGLALCPIVIYGYGSAFQAVIKCSAGRRVSLSFDWSGGWRTYRQVQFMIPGEN